MTNEGAGTPTVNPVLWENLPPQLADAPSVVWKYIGRDGRWTKPPYCAGYDGDRHPMADVMNPATWAGFDQARAFVENNPEFGVGVVLGHRDWPVVAFDMDDLAEVPVEQREASVSWRKRILDMFRGKTYCEVSPSGNGIRILCYGRLPNNATEYLALKTAFPQGIEIYSAKRYVTVTGNRLPVAPQAITDCQVELSMLIADLEAATGVKCAPVELTTPNDALVQNIDADEVLRLAIERRPNLRQRLDTPVGVDGGWSEVLQGLLKDFAAVGSSKLIAYQILEQSRFVLASPEKGGETRARKLHRVLFGGRAREWDKAVSAVASTLGQDVARSLITGTQAIYGQADVQDGTDYFLAAMTLAEALLRQSPTSDIQQVYNTYAKSQHHPTHQLVELHNLVRAKTGQNLSDLRKMFNEALAHKRNIERQNDGLLRNPRDGSLMANEANAIALLRMSDYFAGMFAYDEFMGEEQIIRKVEWSPWDGAVGRRVNDTDLTHITVALQKLGLGIRGKEITTAAVDVVSHDRCKHVIRDSFDALQWDGINRLDTWLIDFCGAEDTPFNRAVGAKWMIGAVARVFKPGCQFDNVLCLEGPQGIGKTSILRLLAGHPDYFIEFTGKFNDPDSQKLWRGKLIVELAEGMSVRKADRDEFKAGISRTHDEYRDSYARKPVKWPRQFAWAYTGNDAQYLNDPTGARRMWPVELKWVNLPALGSVVGELWAEATVRFKQGEAWHLDDAELIAEQMQVVDQRFDEDVWQPRIEAWISNNRSEPLEFIRNASCVLLGCLGMVEKDMTQLDKRRVSEILSRLGYVKKPIRPVGMQRNTKPVHGWWREAIGQDRMRVIAASVFGTSDNFV